MTNYILTPEEIKEIDEISRDTNAIKETLNIALTYHANAISRINEKKMNWWKTQSRIHNLDTSKKYYVDFGSPQVLIREKLRRTNYA